MRKYDGKNKRNIGIIIGICILFAVIFSFFLIKEIKLSKIRYELEKSTVLFDIDKNTILLNDTGIIKKKWGKKFFLLYNDEQHDIGSHVIAFNNNEISLYLYGEFYQINKNSEVEITKEETILNNLGISRFYKIADRKYLLVDQNIRTSDEALKTTNYLVVELDKQGNAILYNNSLNLKVFSATKILTSTYTFDIANELLIFDNEEVDLKKILGTTNEYKEDDNKNKPTDKTPDDNKDEDGDGGSGGSGQGGNENPPADTPGGNGSGQGGTNQPGNSGTGNGENDDTGENPDKDVETQEPNTGTDVTPGEIINNTSYTSIIRVIPYTSSISIDYVIYDKQEKYLSTFVEVRSNNNVQTIHLPKSSTNITLTKLNPGTNYELTFKYTHLNEDVVMTETIDTQNVKTLIPTITLVGTKTTSKKIEYKISISSYQIDSATLKLYVNNEYTGISKEVSGSNITGGIDISKISLPSQALVEIKLENIVVEGAKVNKVATWSYKAPFIADPEPDNPETPEEPTQPDNPETPEIPDEPTPEPPTEPGQQPEGEGGNNE